MGLIGKVLSYVYSSLGQNDDKVGDIKLDPGGEANRTTWHAEPANQTSQPLSGDFICVMPIPGEGKTVAVAFIDPNNPQDIAAGEHKTYARSPDDGAIKCMVHLRNDGTIAITNEAGTSITADSSDGSVTINGVKFDTSGNITGANDITAAGTVEADTLNGTSSVMAAGKEIVNHDHNINSGSSAPGPTGPNN